MAEQNSSRTSREDLQIAVMANDIVYIKKSVDDLTTKVDHNYVTIDQFEPVRRLVYGLVSLILMSVVIALLALVVQK